MRVLSAVMFFPRGGSAHVTRAMAQELPAHGWETTVISGSMPGLGDAAAFYSGLDVHSVDYGSASALMHPSYEDRPGAPDPVFASVGDREYEAHVATWERALLDASAPAADVLHLHHLTPINEAAARVAPGVPIVGHLHGTELLMLEQIAAGPPADWTHAAAWHRRMRRWARQCDRIVVLSQTQVERALAVLEIDPGRITIAANGFDPQRFVHRQIDRASFWERHLVRAPRGWRPGEAEGTIAYSRDQVAPLAAGPVVISVGRFTAVKRTGLLVRAFDRARRETGLDASLVLVGGHPGEWEGEHPYDTVRRCRASNVFLAGWHDHAALPSLFSAADVVALASVREQFGNVLVEGMACGLPAIAVDRFGPAEIVRDGDTGWLVEPDDESMLAGALAQAITDGEECLRRGANAAADVADRFAWPMLAGSFAEMLDELAEGDLREDEQLVGI